MCVRYLVFFYRFSMYSVSTPLPPHPPLAPPTTPSITPPPDPLPRYLRWAGDNGFTRGSLWACPPARGDDYMIHAHPEEQKNPTPARLRGWYIQVSLCDTM